MPRDYIYEDGSLLEGPDEPQQDELQARDMCEELGHPYHGDGWCHCGARRYPVGGPDKAVNVDG
ncbi:MAG: hypothetical protein C4551_06580 [Bacillota bacterium]|jgi:hypothetical protein|nr:MAG: hypothetical protein C4551_06580 [Bacillota bacterium]